MRPLAQRSGRVAKAAMALLWSSAIVVGALATAHTPGLTVSFWRLVSAAPIMGLIAYARAGVWPRRGEILWVATVGVLLQGVQFACVYTAIGEGVPAGLVALLIGSSPVLVAIAGATFFAEPLSRRQWLGSAIGVVGVACAVADDLHGSVSGLGLLLALLGLAGLTGGTLIQRHHRWRADPHGAIFVQILAGTVFVAPLAALGPGFHVDLDYQSLAPLVWFLGPTIGGNLLFLWLLRHQKGGEATSFLYVVPAITAIASVPILGQSLGPGVIVGLVLGLVGVNLVGRADRYEADPVGGAPEASPGFSSTVR